MRILIVGAGAGAAAATVELSKANHDVLIWSRTLKTIEPFIKLSGVGYTGVLGNGVVNPLKITSDIKDAISDVDGCVIVLPTFTHAHVAKTLAQAGWGQDRPVLLNPGHTGGALEFSNSFKTHSSIAPPIAELSTLTYVARKLKPDTVTITGRAKSVRLACLPGGTKAVEMASELFPGLDVVPDVLYSGLSNANLVLHPPGAILTAGWVEATGGNFTFYVDAMTKGVARVMQQLDNERRAVGAAFGHKLPSLIEEMQQIGTVEEHVLDKDDFASAISGGEANRTIRAPDSLQHRYYQEDFAFGLLPLIEFAKIADVATPTAWALFTLAKSLVGVDYIKIGRTAKSMGIDGFDRDKLIEYVAN